MQKRMAGCAFCISQAMMACLQSTEAATEPTPTIRTSPFRQTSDSPHRVWCFHPLVYLLWLNRNIVPSLPQLKTGNPVDPIQWQVRRCAMIHAGGFKDLLHPMTLDQLQRSLVANRDIEKYRLTDGQS